MVIEIERQRCASRTSLLLTALVLGLVGCGDDDKGDKGTGGGGSGGGTSAGSNVCYAECEGQAAKGCLVVANIEECRNVCGGLKQLPAACYQALEASSQCRVANADPCAVADPDPCEDEFEAIVAACM